MAEIAEDHDGFPVMFAARAPGQVAPQPSSSGAVILRGAASGNPNADPVNGRFAPKAGGRTVKQVGNDVVVTQQTKNIPQGFTAEQWTKRQDIVRDAARELSDLDPTKAKAFLKAHPNVDENAVNLDSFVADVRSAKLDDLTDILNQQLKTGIVKVAAGKRYVKSAMAGLSPDEMTNVLRRLAARGWSNEDILSKVVSKVKNPELKASLEQTYGESSKKGG